MTDRVDFSANAGIYDRRHGVLSAEDLDKLWHAAGLRIDADVLDVGAGTGRVAIPLASRACRVVAVDPAIGMLHELRDKAAGIKVSPVLGAGAQLPVLSERFDAVVIARLLYLATDWSQILHEARRVLVVGGCLLHEWGNGQDDEEWVLIREEARRLFESAGVVAPFHPGVSSETAIEEMLAALHLVRERDVMFGPGPSITIREFLRRLCEGELSYIWDVPDTVRAEHLPHLTAWVERTFDVDRSVAMPRELRWTVYRKHAA